MDLLPGETKLILKYNGDAINRPILQKCTKAYGVKDEPMPISFLAVHESTMKNTGCLYGTSIHIIRRELGRRVDGKILTHILVTSIWSSRTCCPIANSRDIEMYTKGQHSQHLT